MRNLYSGKEIHETAMIKHLVAVGFALYYSYTLFTCSNNLVFAFVIPMIVMVTIFNDSKYSIEINTGTVILSIITAVAGSRNGLFGYEGADDAILQVIIMILVAAFSIYSAKISHANSKQVIDDAVKAKNDAEELLKKVETLSAAMHDGIKDIYGDLEHLNEATPNPRRIPWHSFRQVRQRQRMPYRNRHSRQKKSRTKWLLLPRRREALLTV